MGQNSFLLYRVLVVSPYLKVEVKPKEKNREKKKKKSNHCQS
jgi:hypothetical protein